MQLLLQNNFSLQLYNCSVVFILKMWTEVTDPLKYVYEDIAIATYLIVSVSMLYSSKCILIRLFYYLYNAFPI